jgi:hypothetical protein
MTCQRTRRTKSSLQAGPRSRGTSVWPDLWRVVAVLAALYFVDPAPALAQNAELSGVVRDQQGAAVADATVRLVDLATGVAVTTSSNTKGVYVFPSLKPATYRLEIIGAGFAPAVNEALVLNVDQRLVFDVSLLLEGRAETVTVTSGRSTLSTTDGSVATVIDRRFAADLPTRGRSFSALVSLAPGVTMSPTSTSTGGSEFSVNGQRTTSNSLTVDGVPGLSEMDSGGISNAAGQRLSSTVTGTVSGGLSMDAVQEIRVQTSSFAAEFGRTPGGQISLITRSGSNLMHGSLFEQFRDDSLTANEWFANSAGLAKPPLSEHQFGGTLGGPVLRKRTFFFVSYDGLRLTQPRTVNESVPSKEIRQVPSRAQALLNAYPGPTGPTEANQTAKYIANHPVNVSSDVFGLRFDHVLSSRVQMFGRYARVPSHNEDDSPFASSKIVDKKATSVTGGLTSTLGARLLVDVRAAVGSSRYGYTSGTNPALTDWFGITSGTAWSRLAVTGLPTLYAGPSLSNVQHQGHVDASASYVFGTHHVKAGFLYGRLSPTIRPRHDVNATVQGLTPLVNDTVVRTLAVVNDFTVDVHFDNYSAYVQDAWKVRPNLSVTYGVRWDVNKAPSFGPNQGPLAVETLTPLTSLKLVPAQNVPLWETNYSNVVPRFGFSYAFGSEGKLVLSGGAGLFNDLDGPAATTNVGGSARLSRANVALPLMASDLRGVTDPILSPPYTTSLSVVDPNLESPRTTQWNLTLERMLGDSQSVSISYVGARGERLLQRQEYGAGLNASFLSSVSVTTAAGTSRYRSLQLQYRRRAAAGLQVLGSYAFSDAKDTTSSVTATDRALTLAPSQFDLRHSAKVAATWTLPELERGPAKWMVNGWALHGILTARSGYPFTVVSSALVLPGEENLQARASLVPGVPILLDDPTAPGGRRYNRAAFVDPPAGQHGDTGRNAFRGYSSWQVDMGLQRSIRVTSDAKVQIRVDGFNLFNTPVFSLPVAFTFATPFGVPMTTGTTASSATGAQSLYQVGGPRSVMLSAHLQF